MSMSTVTLQEAQSGLADLIHGLRPGQVVMITENARPVAQLTPAPAVVAQRVRGLGLRSRERLKRAAQGPDCRSR